VRLTKDELIRIILKKRVKLQIMKEKIKTTLKMRMRMRKEELIRIILKLP
jgi:hypothetical protein